MKTKQLIDQRNQAAARITDLANRVNTERRDFTADERQSWDAANKEFDRLKREIEVEQRAEDVRREQERRIDDPLPGREDTDRRRAERRDSRRENVVHTEEQRTLAFAGWCRRQTGRPLTAAQRQACKALRFDPSTTELRIGMWADTHTAEVQRQLSGTNPDARANIIRRESRANMSAQLGTAGNYLVSPGTLANALETNLLAFGGVRQVAEIITTTSGEPLFLPVIDDTANSGTLLGENTQAMSSGVNPSLKTKRLDAYKFTSTPVLIPSELLEDSQFELPSYVGEMLGVRLGRGTAPYYATGTGASQPEGIVTGATLGITAASATAIKFDELVQLVHSIDPAYRSMPGVGWLMHDLVKSYIRQIKDGTGRPLWISGENYNAGNREGEPETLLGYKLNICQEMASTVATANKTALFGLLSKYKIRRVRDYRMYRLQERFRDMDQDGFIVFTREDGKLLDAGTHPVKYLQQA